MKLEELQRDWQSYVWEWLHNGKFHRIILKEAYCKCGLVAVGERRSVPALRFYKRHDDGSWANNPVILKCDKDGNCYLYTFYVRNINKFYWKKTGRFVKLTS